MSEGVAADTPLVVASARVIRAAECHSMPWKNGGGATTEVCVYPPGAGLEDFGWRVSIATVASDGPFSVFAGVDRTLTLLAGDGLWLAIGDAAPVLMGRDSAPLSFPADVPTRSTLIGSPVTDLNVMTRRGGWRHAVTRQAFEGGSMQVSEKHTTAATVLWLCHLGDLKITCPSGEVRLGPGDALLAEQLMPYSWRVTSHLTDLFLIEIEPDLKRRLGASIQER
jgi:environmental stress-induced protein Ves